MKNVGETVPGKCQLLRCPAAGCKAFYRKEGKLQDHMAGHSEQKPWKCGIKDCDKVFARKRQILKHVKRHLALKKLSCPTAGCKMTFSTKKSLSRHKLYKHGEAVPLKCSVPGCKRSFRKKRALRRHLSVHSNEPLSVCDVPGCSWKSSSVAKLVAHQKRHRGYRCSYEGCQTVSPTWTALQTHMKKHPLELQCAACKKPFKKASALRRHKATHAKKPLQLPCPRQDCDKTFSSVFNLTHHVRKLHLCLQTHRCPHSGCTRSFAMRESLLRHLVVHDPERKKLKLKFVCGPSKFLGRGTRCRTPVVEEDLSHLFSRKLLFHFKTRLETNLSGLFNERQLREPAEPEVNLSGLFQRPQGRAKAEKSA
uniref:C2H2-type domain-containing protein n=1 Tax=Xenopus laevis TaxID=8355 RepID=A9JS67_XENLA|nr:Unknown (protein for MGC:181861) [Xenopus laevis]